MITLVVLCILVLSRTAVVADPISKPYVAFRTSPFDAATDTATDTTTMRTMMSIHSAVQEEAATPIDPILNRCASPLNITIKHSAPISKSHASSPVIAKPVIYPLHSHGPNQSILFLHFREVFDMVNFGNLDHKEDSFPMLFQGSTFLASPIITDVNLDGIEDAILVDYNGIITSIGLSTSLSHNENGQRRRHRFFRERDIPKLYVRKDWVKHACNRTLVEEVILKSNLQPFHSYFEYSSEWSSSHKITTSVRGEHADIIQQSAHTIQNIEHHRRLLDEESSMDEDHSSASIRSIVDDNINMKHEHYYRYDDDYFQHFGDSSYYESQRQFYKDENYIPLPPHVLSTPTLFHVKQDPQSELIHTKYDEYLAIAVSYYFDEDDHHHNYSDAGHPKNMTEAIRGQYMATAIVIYNLEKNAFTQEIHLDMSTDFTAPLVGSFTEDEHVQWNDENYNGFISLALASPTPVDLEDDGKMEILLGTSMGRIYCVCATLGDEIFSVQMPGRIEKPIVADNLLSGEGYEHLEILAVDSLANIVCLTSKGVAIWTKALISGVTVKSTSDIILSDMNGDGQIDIVLSVITDKYLYLHALQSSDGSALDGYPKEFQIESAFTSEYRLPSPIVASSTVIQAVGSKLYIFDTMADCIHDYDLGDSIVTLVSGDADGDDGLDIIATTRDGIVALDTSIVPTLSTRNSIGIHVDESTRVWQNFHGITIPVRFQIFDNGPDTMNVDKKTYPVEMVVARSSTKVIFRKEYIQDGSYSEIVPFPFPPGFYSVTIRMRIDGRIFEDVFHFGFHVDPSMFMIFKWIILVPLFLTLIMLLFFMPRPMSEREIRGKDTLPSHLD